MSQLPSTIPHDWLVEIVLARSFEAVSRHEISKADVSDKYIDELLRRLGGNSERWDEFIRQLKDDDELWYFKSPPRTWQSLSGRSGYAIVRDSRIIGHYVTWMN